jgi:hypothetical protein
VAECLDSSDVWLDSPNLVNWPLMDSTAEALVSKSEQELGKRVILNLHQVTLVVVDLRMIQVLVVTFVRNKVRR